ncbi:bifunctional adenosylcobinamide kinase/adenosylcobinamide-phosphate guanylyltransferase [Halomonas piscis]|uniref:bifunctional adenosylcobinamide kinase/adenosylcobinamide-phosphate guanylyltransferase n=1 Tax=Halomonas piscis TaxID=3031727 RepID=UPI00289B912B|nr:bifunctional adenosylcobinamide kinase/adenosylcobinamide-phosphate guanylyltransferase [Halomonas piscis]
MIVFISGGARSGKSAVAEAEVRKAAGATAPYYIATANASDAEMATRIARHRASRGLSWVTLEAPLALAPAIARVPDGGAALLDCLTLWASQVLYPQPPARPFMAEPVTPEQALADLGECLNAARRRGMTLAIVSNDLNEALLSDDAETWRYVAFLQRAHRLVARRADSVLEVAAGQPLEWKPASMRDRGDARR